MKSIIMNGQIPDPTPEEINELHSAIQDYLNTIDKLKKYPGLKNYHKYYKTTLNKRFLYKREKELVKAHQLIPPGIGTVHNFNIYQFFQTKSNKISVPIAIIDTLLVSKKENTMIYLKNNSDGIIEGIFQEFIFSSSITSFLRIHWKHNKKLRGYLIGNINKVKDFEEKKFHSKLLNNKSATRHNSLKEFKSEEALISNAHKIIAITESFFKPKNSIVSQLINLLSENFEQDCCVLDSVPLKSLGPINSLKDQIESTCFNTWNEKKKLEVFLTENI